MNRPSRIAPTKEAIARPISNPTKFPSSREKGVDIAVGARLSRLLEDRLDIVGSAIVDDAEVTIASDGVIEYIWVFEGST
jgi:hypothetical protein